MHASPLLPFSKFVKDQAYEKGFHVDQGHIEEILVRALRLASPTAIRMKPNSVVGAVNANGCSITNKDGELIK